MKIFCDLDGTLLDVSTRHYTVYTELVQAFSGKPLDKTSYWNLKRKKTRWPELLPLSGISAAKLEPFLAEFIQKIEDPTYLKIDTLFPGVLTTLENITKHNQCYLVSLRRKPENLQAQLEWLGLRNHFQKVLSGHSKGDGYDVKIALIKKELDGEEGIIVGDTEADIVTGKELGIITIALLSGIRDEQFLTALHPDYITSGFSDIEALQILK